MRIALLAIVCVIAACTPSPPASEREATRLPSTVSNAGGEASAGAPPAWADVENEPFAAGRWISNADETRAEFAGDAPPPALTFGCDRDFLQFERNFSQAHGVAPGGPGTPFNVVSPRETIAYTAIAAVDGSPRLWLAAGRHDFRLDDFVASEEGFAIQTVGDLTRFPHDPMLARVLANCRARSLVHTLDQP